MSCGLIQQLTRLYGVERAASEDEEGLAVLASEDEIDGAVWDFDGVDELAGWIVDVDLSGSDVDVAFGILCDAFTALLGEEFGIGEGSVGRYRDGLGLLFGFVADVEGFAWGCVGETEGAKKVGHLGAVVEGSGDEVFTSGDEG